MEEKFTEIFSINDSEINTKEIMEEIEKKLLRSPVSKEELERVASLRFHPETPEGFRDFDASEIAHLFEKGITSPKFTNPKLWFVRGPLKWIITRFVEFYAFIDKKLSENRIRSFYSVLHELILLRTKYNRLEKQFQEFYKDHVDLLNSLGRGPEPEFQWASDEFYSGNTPSSADQLILSLLPEGANVLALAPEWGELLKYLELSQIRFKTVVWDKGQETFIRSRVTDQIYRLGSGQLLPPLDDFSAIVFSSNVCYLPQYLIEKLLLEISRQARPNTLVIFPYSNHSIRSSSPFQKLYQTQIEDSRLTTYLKDLGYHTIFKQEAENSMVVFSFRK